MYAVTNPEEDSDEGDNSDEATGAESSSDEEEDAGPESSDDEADEEAAGSSDEEEEVAPPAPSSGRPRGRRRRAPKKKKKSRVDEVEGEWEKEDNTPIDIPYQCVAGPHRGVVSPMCTILDAFYVFFTTQVWELLVSETNAYGARIIPGSWRDTDERELKAYLGILIVMGIVQLPRLAMYWSTTHEEFAPVLVRKVMPRDRFFQLSRCLHVNATDPSSVTRGVADYDRLYKVRKLLDLVVPKFESVYTLHKELSLDEAMIKFKGRLGFKQYMKDKPTKWGIKVFVLSDATNGYIYRLEIYTGKNETLDNATGLCSRVVLDLMKGFDYSGNTLYMDRYYSSPRLFFTLGKIGIGCCGTVQNNRKEFPQVLKISKSKKNKGKYDYRSNQTLTAMVWFDKRPLYMLSTIHKPTSSSPTTVLRTQVTGSRVAVDCPPCLPDYQKYMRGVDRGDQMIGYYNIGRRSKKWWKRVFTYIVECSILNAYVLFSCQNPRSKKLKFRFLEQRINLAKALIGSYTGCRKRGRTPQVDSERLNRSLDHFADRAERKGECVVCRSRHGKRRDTMCVCTVCKVNLCSPLAGGERRQCFREYHTMTDYSQK